ncbi:hypothetical protein H310_07318 [Aphanomyces invadans]|uniref:HIT domain-containing protein n=1 Tax=Aphanomyces invadans TaxID=157072 RepID=A0A024U2X7_9STRA|nr:hypothetical protein H310_07318 [Aphanomyces invadans]ETW00781.1 hypothetical protein H310_07318 [Aphanomyces invadans]|eukprot:XP_008870916.1 hypothetical protein H310_07318 [Aphanomyces invadans]
MNRLRVQLCHPRFGRPVPQRTMATEAERANAAVEPKGYEPTIFDKIIRREIPASVVFENDKVLAFRDIAPQAPVHVIVIPKVRDGLTRIANAEERHKEILGELLYSASVVAKNEQLDEGYRIVINDGPRGLQSVYHLHLHILGGRTLSWPPG